MTMTDNKPMLQYFCFGVVIGLWTYFLSQYFTFNKLNFFLAQWVSYVVFASLISYPDALKAKLQLIIGTGVLALIASLYGRKFLGPGQFLLGIQFVMSLLIALTYYCQWNAEQRFDYPTFFKNAWRLFFVLSFTVVFLSLAFYLWGVFIDFGRRFGMMPWFRFLTDELTTYLLVAISGSVGVGLSHRYLNAFDDIRQIHLSFFKLLYPFVIIATIALIIYSPFSYHGLNTMWPVLVGLGIFNVLFFNSLYLDGCPDDKKCAQSSYWLAFSLVLFALLGILSVSAIVIALRGTFDITQLLLNNGIFWLLLLALYSFSYSFSMLKFRRIQAALIGKVNMCLPVLAAMVFLIMPFIVTTMGYPPKTILNYSQNDKETISSHENKKEAALVLIHKQ